MKKTITAPVKEKTKVAKNSLRKKLTDQDIKTEHEDAIRKFYTENPDAPIELGMDEQKALDLLENDLKGKNAKMNIKDSFAQYRAANNQVTDITSYIFDIVKDLKLSKVQHTRENAEKIKKEIIKTLDQNRPDAIKAMHIKYVLGAFNININAFFLKIKPKDHHSESVNKLNFDTPDTEGRALEGAETLSEKIEKYEATRVKYKLINDTDIVELESLTDECLEAFRIDPSKFKTVIGKTIIARIEFTENAEVIRAMNQDDNFQTCYEEGTEPEDENTASGFKPIAKELKDKFIRTLREKKWGDSNIALNYIGSLKASYAFENHKKFWLPIIKYWEATMMCNPNYMQYKSIEENQAIKKDAQKLLEDAIKINPEHNNVEDAKEKLKEIAGMTFQETDLDF